MQKPAPYIVVILSLFIFSLLFLISPRESIFFQISFHLGLKTYLLFVFISIFFTEYIVEKIQRGTSSSEFYIAFPALYITLLIILFFIIFSIAETPRSSGHGSGFAGLVLLFYISIGGFIYGLARAIFFLSAKNQPDSITKTFKSINHSLNKNFKLLIPVLSISSVLIFSLAYFDFKTSDISTTSNLAALNADINNKLYPSKIHIPNEVLYPVTPKQLTRTVRCKVDPNDPPALFSTFCVEKIDGKAP